jgi:hypothetical protein
MGGDIFHGMTPGEQITNIAKICIIGNLRNSLLIYSNLSRNFLLGPSKAAEAEDGGGLAVGIVEYPLDLDGWELGTNGQGFRVGIDGLTALVGSGVDGGVPGQVFDFNFNGGNGGLLYCLYWGLSIGASN